MPRLIDANNVMRTYMVQVISCPTRVCRLAVLSRYPANLEICENLEKVSLFPAREKSGNLIKCFKSGNPIGPREKMASLLCFVSCPNSVCTG